MKSVIKRLQNQNPFLSSLMIFNMAVREYKYPKSTIDKNFDEFVDKKDYARKDRDAVLEHTYTLNK